MAVDKVLRRHGHQDDRIFFLIEKRPSTDAAAVKAQQHL
jgi:hypothetical protein